MHNNVIMKIIYTGMIAFGLGAIIFLTRISQAQNATNPEDYVNAAQCGCGTQIMQILGEQQRTNSFLAQLVQQCTSPQATPYPTVSTTTTSSTTTPPKTRVIICGVPLRLSSDSYRRALYDQQYGAGNWEYGGSNCLN